jgi:hypothetical protein
MAVNLPPHYHDAEARYKKAQSPEDKLAALREMWVLLPKHKASEKVQADLKTKISELTDQIEQAKAGPKKAAPGTFKFPRQGAGQVVFVGPPNAGKSLLLTKLTKAHAGGRPVPVHDARAGPGDDGLRGRARPTDRPAAGHRRPLRNLRDRPDAGGRRGGAVPRPVGRRRPGGDARRPRPPEAGAARAGAARRPADRRPDHLHAPDGAGGDKVDDDASDIRLEIAREEFGTRFPLVVASAERGDGLDVLRKALYDALGVMRVYTKQPGKPADMTNPFTPPVGSTVADLAGKVHRDLEDAVKSARVWGAGGS